MGSIESPFAGAPRLCGTHRAPDGFSPRLQLQSFHSALLRRSHKYGNELPPIAQTADGSGLGASLHNDSDLVDTLQRRAAPSGAGPPGLALLERLLKRFSNSKWRSPACRCTACMHTGCWKGKLAATATGGNFDGNLA